MKKTTGNQQTIRSFAELPFNSPRHINCLSFKVNLQIAHNVRLIIYEHDTITISFVSATSTSTNPVHREFERYLLTIKTVSSHSYSSSLNNL